MDQDCFTNKLKGLCVNYKKNAFGQGQCKWVEGTPDFSVGSEMSEFEQQGIGNCGDNRFPIEDEEECERAAKALGLTDVTAALSSKSTRPYGCYYKVSSGSLWINYDGDKNSDETDRQAICYTEKPVVVPGYCKHKRLPSMDQDCFTNKLKGLCVNYKKNAFGQGQCKWVEGVPEDMVGKIKTIRTIKYSERIILGTILLLVAIFLTLTCHSFKKGDNVEFQLLEGDGDTIEI